MRQFAYFLPLILFSYTVVCTKSGKVSTDVPYQEKKLRKFMQGVHEELYAQEGVTDREHYEYCYAQAELFCKKEDFDKALFWLHTALKVMPKDEKVLLRIVDVYVDQEKIDEAIAFLQKEIEADPENVALVEKAAIICSENKKKEEAIGYCERAVELNSSNVAMYKKLTARDFPDKISKETLTFCLRAIELTPEDHGVYFNTGFILQYLNRPAEAIPYFQKALEIDPAHESTHRRLSKSYLKTGQMLKGWWHQQWRTNVVPYEDLCIEDVKGKCVALTPEAELGDMIQFVRFAACLKEAGAKEVWLYTYDSLIQLLATCPFLDKVMSRRYVQAKTSRFKKFIHKFFVGKADIELRLQSLPLMLKTTVETLPAPNSYLRADEQLVAQWKDTLAQDSNFKVGICWATNKMFIEDNPWTKRSVHINTFSPLADIENLSLYSLQKYNGLDQLEELEDGFTVHTFDDDFDKTHGRFMDTAAVMKNLDLVLTVDTSIAHLAGALGVPVWVMLPYNNEYRWMQERTDTPWYPTMRLFRCKEPESWDEVMQEVKVALIAKKSSASV